MEYFLGNFQAFLLILSRILGLFFLAPVFSQEVVPNSVRIFLSFLIAIVLFPVTSSYLPDVPGNMMLYAVYVFSEILIGVIMGFLLQIIFSAFQMAGEFFNVQIGFSYTEVLDPVSQVSLPVISTLKSLMGILVFLSTGAYRLLIEALAYSFQKVQFITLEAEKHRGIYKIFEETIGAMFLVAFKIALPVMGILLLVTIAEALMGKSAPQLNIMQLSFPIKVVVGMFVLISIMSFIILQMEAGIQISFDKIFRLLRNWPGVTP